MIIKYKVEKSFKDKYSKKDIIANDVIEVTVERMKELNSKNIGRVVDIIEVEKDINTDEKDITDIENNKVEDEFDTKKDNVVDDSISETGSNKLYTAEELSDMTVNDLKELAEKLNIELTKAKKDEIIEEILANNK